MKLITLFFESLLFRSFCKVKVQFVGSYIKILLFSAGFASAMSSYAQDSVASVPPMDSVAADSAGLELEGVTVTTSRRFLVHDRDRLVFNVKSSPFSSGFNARDVLSQIPVVDPSVQDGLKLIGKDGVIVLLNGRRVNLKGKELAGFLGNIPSDKISKIEVMTNPSPEFSASGNTGVLNIILKNRRNLGFEGSVGAGYTQRRKATGNETVGLSFSNKCLMIDYNADNWNENRRQDIRSVYDYSGYSKIYSEITDHKYDILYQNLNTNIFLTGRMNLGFMSSFNMSRDKSTKTTGIETSGGQPSASLSALASSHDRYRFFSLSPYYEWTIDSLGKKLSVNYSHVSSSDKDSKDYFSDVSIKSGSYDNRYMVNVFNLDMNLPFSFLNFELGGSYSHYRTDYSSRYATDDSFLYKETVGAFYADVNKAWGRWYAKAGLRYEHTKTQGFPMEPSGNFTRSYADWFPFVDVSYRTDKSGSFIFGYSRRINRPVMTMLTPTKVYSDIYNYSMGNPYLAPSLSGNLELKYLFKNLYVGLSHIHTSGGVALLLDDSGSPVMAQTYTNCITTDSYGGTVNYTYSRNRLNASLGMSMFYNSSKSYDARVADDGLDGLSTQLTANLSYMISKDVLAYAGYFYNFAGKSGYVHYKEFNALSAGLNWRLLKNRLIIDLRANDLFRTMKNRNTIYFDGFTFYNRLDNDNCSLTLKLTYKFGNNKLKRSNVGVDNGGNRIPGARK